MDKGNILRTGQPPDLPSSSMVTLKPEPWIGHQASCSLSQLISTSRMSSARRCRRSQLCKAEGAPGSSSAAPSLAGKPTLSRPPPRPAPKQQQPQTPARQAPHQDARDRDSAAAGPRQKSDSRNLDRSSEWSLNILDEVALLDDAT